MVISSSNLTFAQTNDVRILLEPSTSQKILAWDNPTTLIVDSWRVDILKEEINNGVSTMALQIQFFQNKQYLGVDNQYMTGEYFYQVFGLDPNGNVICDNGGPVGTYPGYDVVNICSQECNGPDYAYELEQYGSSTVGYYLSASQAVAFVDPVTSTVTPYFHYMNQSTWDSLNASQAGNPYAATPNEYKTILFNINDMPNGFFVKNAQGTGLFGPWIKGVEKKMGIFSDYSGKQTSSLSTQLACSPTLSDYISIFNQNKQNCDPSWPNLVCNPDPNTFIMGNTGLIFTNDPTAHDTCDTCIYHDQVTFPWYPYGYFSAGNGDTSLLPGTGGILSLSNLNLALKYITDITNNNGLEESDFIQFEFQKVVDPSFSLILKPSDIEQENGALSFEDYSFSDGLYRLNIFYTNNVLFPVYFESIGQGTSSNTTLSSFLTATIYPVPITNNEFAVKFLAQENLVFTYEMFDLNGVLLATRVFNINNGEEIIYHTSINAGVVLPSNMLVNKFSFDDGSSFTIQTIRSVN